MTKREFAVLAFRLMGAYSLIVAVQDIFVWFDRSSRIVTIGALVGASQEGYWLMMLTPVCLQIAIGAFLIGCAPLLASLSVGASDALLMTGASAAGRAMVLWAIGVFLLAVNLPKIFVLLWLAMFPGGASTWGLEERFSIIGQTVIGLYLHGCGMDGMRRRPSSSAPRGRPSDTAR